MHCATGATPAQQQPGIREIAQRSIQRYYIQIESTTYAFDAVRTFRRSQDPKECYFSGRRTKTTTSQELFQVIHMSNIYKCKLFANTSCGQRFSSPSVLPHHAGLSSSGPRTEPCRNKCRGKNGDPGCTDHRLQHPYAILYFAHITTGEYVSVGL